jgi:hypothetical protein
MPHLLARCNGAIHAAGGYCWLLAPAAPTGAGLEVADAAGPWWLPSRSALKIFALAESLGGVESLIALPRS